MKQEANRPYQIPTAVAMSSIYTSSMQKVYFLCAVTPWMYFIPALIWLVYS